MKQIKLALMIMALLATITSCRSEQSGQKADQGASPHARSKVSLADFFAYSCVQAYTTKHELPAFDSSVAYAVEFSTGSAEDFSRLYEQAEAFAAQMPAPDMSDPEHGRVAVMARCLEQSRKL